MHLAAHYEKCHSEHCRYHYARFLGGQTKFCYTATVIIFLNYLQCQRGGVLLRTTYNSLHSCRVKELSLPRRVPEAFCCISALHPCSTCDGHWAIRPNHGNGKTLSRCGSIRQFNESSNLASVSSNRYYTVDFKIAMSHHPIRDCSLKKEPFQGR